MTFLVAKYKRPFDLCKVKKTPTVAALTTQEILRSKAILTKLALLIILYSFIAIARTL